jgi:RND family efflux transporter MFP subunit
MIAEARLGKALSWTKIEEAVVLIPEAWARRFPVLLLFFLSSNLASGCKLTKPPAPTPPTPIVTVAKPGSQAVTDYREYRGYLDAVETVSIRARVRGFLQKIHFQEGSDVKKNDLLYEVDPREFEANVDKAKADLAKAKAEYGRVKSEEDRAAKLRVGNAISEEEYVQKAVATETARASVDQANAAVQSANLDLSFTKIHSPIDGRIGRTLVTEGNLVGYNEATVLTTIVRMDPIYVYFDVPEQYAIKYSGLARQMQAKGSSELKLPIDLEVAEEKAFPHHGHIDFHDNRVDPGTGTIRLRAILPNSDRTLYPGLYALVRVPQGEAQTRLTIPESALMSDQRGRFVFVVKADNTIEARTLTLGSPVGSLVSVIKGLQPDDEVVVNGLQRARPGVKVEKQAQGSGSKAPGGGTAPASTAPAATAPAPKKAMPTSPQPVLHDGDAGKK